LLDVLMGGPLYRVADVIAAVNFAATNDILSVLAVAGTTSWQRRV
jgi:hypothetical protein